MDFRYAWLIASTGMISYFATAGIGASPIRVDFPNDERTFYFDWTIEWRKTSSIYAGDQGSKPIHFDVDSQNWYTLSKQEGAACNAKDEQLLDVDVDRVLLSDGLHRNLIAINGQSPGPVIVVPLGAYVVLKVRNRLITEAVTVHMHGLDNRWFMDGVGYIQQCPIHVMSTFVYRFRADQPGTHFYHGHLKVDRGEGLLGALIVIESDQSLQLPLLTLAKSYDSHENGRDHATRRIIPDIQFSLVLEDKLVSMNAKNTYIIERDGTWRFSHGFDEPKDCYATDNTYDGTAFGGASSISAITVNGKGWHVQEVVCSFSSSHPSIQRQAVQDIIRRPHDLPLETLVVNAGENVLLRLINGAVAYPFMVSFEDHDFWVVATDGHKIKPVKSHAVIFYPGERYDILVENVGVSLSKSQFLIKIETLANTDFWKKWTQPVFAAAKIQLQANRDEQQQCRCATGFVDWGHHECSHTTETCKVVNCPFPQFPPGCAFQCITMDRLKALDVIDDRHLLKIGYNKADGVIFQEIFLNLVSTRKVNSFAFEPPASVPYFHENDMERIAALCNSSEPNKPCFHYFNISAGAIVQMVVVNLGLGQTHHPFHMHGSHFRVMKIAYGDYDQRTNFIKGHNKDIKCDDDELCTTASWQDPNWSHGNVPGMNTVDPASKDTVLIPVGGYAVLRFRANNTGWFYAHCHLMMHHVLGMAFALKIGETHEMPKPPANFPNGCGHFDFVDDLT